MIFQVIMAQEDIVINNCCQYLRMLVNSDLNFAFHENLPKIKLLDQLELLAN